MLLSHLTQEIANAYIARTRIREILTHGIAEIRSRLQGELANAPVVQDLGLAVSSVRVSAVKPSADLEKAIEAPAREQIKQAADEAAYARRATAVEKERAISENEMQNRIELAKREELLLEQQGQNAKRQAEDVAQAQRIASEVERARMELYQELPAAVLLGLALRDIAGKIGKIEHLNVTPEFLSPLIGDFLQGRRREA